MIRVVIFLAAAGTLALGVAWFAERPGEVTINWLGYRIETSVMVAAFVVALIAIFLISLWSLLRAIVRTPDQVSLFLRHRRALRGYLAITRGLIAVGAGDARLAQKSAEDAARLSPGDPLALLLGAQSAQMAGERIEAERIFRIMAARDDTKLLGLRGLYIEAQRRNDLNDARLFAEQAVRSPSSPAWAGQAVLDYRCTAGDWAAALEALDSMKSALDRAVYRRQRAVLLTARALASADTDRDGSRALALEAIKLAPDLVPAAALAGRQLAEAGETRKAGKILTAAWQANPHPDIAEAYANLRFGDTARDRRARVKKLADRLPDHIESALALARAALDTREFAEARKVLASYLASPTRRVAALMAEIEQTEHGDEGRAREWLTRAMRAAPDPAWTADGVVSDRWMPISPVSGRLDAFQWKVPLAEIGVERPLIEPDPPLLPALVPANSQSAPIPKAARDARPPSDQTLKPDTEKTGSGTAERKATAKPVTVAEPVIPLVHAPDDPGPDPTLELDPVPEPGTPRADAWERIRQLFR